MDDAKAMQVVRICEKLHPFMQKHIMKLMDDYDPEVVISVTSSVVVNLMAHAITMVEVRGGDIDEFVRILMRAVSEKQGEMYARVQTEAVLEKMVIPGGKTCRPMH